MDLQTAENERIIRYYRSAQETLLRDYQQGFPLLRSLPNDAMSAHVFAAYCMTLTPEEAAILISATVKRFHSRALILLGETMSAEEGISLEETRSILSGCAARERLMSYKGRPLICTANGRRIKKYIRAGIKEILPDASLLRGSGELCYKNQWKDWYVETSFELDKQDSYSLYYDQKTYRKDLLSPENKDKKWPSNVLVSRISNLHSWLGLGQSKWEIYFEEDEEMVVNRMLQLCRCYIDHLPELLDGLNIED